MNAISNSIMKKNQKSENKTPIMVNSKEKTSKCLLENWKWCWTWNSLITEVYIVPRTGACRFGSVCATVLGSFHWQDRSGSTAPCQKPGPTINHTNPQRKLFTFSFSGFKTFSEENVLWTNLEWGLVYLAGFFMKTWDSLLPYILALPQNHRHKSSNFCFLTLSFSILLLYFFIA